MKIDNNSNTGQSGNQGQREQGSNSQSGNQGSSRSSTQSGASGKNSDSDNDNRGFAGMDSEKQREIAAKGGKAAHESGNAHEFTSEEAREAGRKSHDNDSKNGSNSSSANSR